MQVLRLVLILSTVTAQVMIFTIELQKNKAESDFPAFYSAAMLWRAGANPYDFTAQCKQQETLRPASECLPMAHPPLLLPIMAAVSDQNFVASYWRWLSVLMLLTLLCAVVLYGLTRDVRFTLQALCFLPVLVAIVLAQDTALLLFAMLTWVWLLFAGRDLLAGLALSLAVIKPQLAILFALPLLFTHAKAFAGFVAGAVMWVLLSVALVGISGLRGLVDIVQRMSVGQGLGVARASMPNLTGLLVWLHIKPVWAWLGFVVGLCLIGWLWRKRIDVRTLTIGIGIALFVSPHLHVHDLALLLVPLAFANRLALAATAAAIMLGVNFHLEPMLGLCLCVGITLVNSKRALSAGPRPDQPNRRPR